MSEGGEGYNQYDKSQPKEDQEQQYLDPDQRIIDQPVFAELLGDTRFVPKDLLKTEEDPEKQLDHVAALYYFVQSKTTKENISKALKHALAPEYYQPAQTKHYRPLEDARKFYNSDDPIITQLRTYVRDFWLVLDKDLGLGKENYKTDGRPSGNRGNTQVPTFRAYLAQQEKINHLTNLVAMHDERYPDLSIAENVTDHIDASGKGAVGRAFAKRKARE